MYGCTQRAASKPWTNALNEFIKLFLEATRFKYERVGTKSLMEIAEAEFFRNQNQDVTNSL